LNNSEYDKAIEAYQKILDMNPKSNFLVWIYYGMGLAYSMKENYEKALDAFNKCLNLYYEDPNIHMEIKEIYFKQGQMEKAKQSLSNIISFADDVNIYLRLAYSYYYDFNDYFMVENMCKYADSYAKSAWDYITTGDWFRTLNKKQNAEDEYRKALVVAVTFQDYIDIARGFVNTGTSDEVLGALDKAVPLAKTFSDHYSLGRIFNEISDNEKAAGEFDTAASVAETFMDHQKIGDEFFMLKDKKAKAAVSYDRAMAKAKSPEELHDIGYRYLRAGRINKAIAAFQNSLKIKEILNTYLYLGKAYIKKGMIKEANKCYESAGNLAEANENDLLRIRAAKERVKNLSMFRKADGVVIVSFTENSKAEIAGFKPGDIIVSFDNTDISFAYELRLAGKICSTKSSVPVQIVRDGKKISMTSDCGSLGFNAWDF
jgi:tetratricopeptide (TPR) repeat protein